MDISGMCITGATVDDDGVCVEHGERACVVVIPRPRDPEPD